MFRRQRSLFFVDNERDTGRLEAFSDGVIAIAAGSIPINSSSRRNVGFTKDDTPNQPAKEAKIYFLLEGARLALAGVALVREVDQRLFAHIPGLRGFERALKSVIKDSDESASF